MSGHGWVTPNPGGGVARCGGPGLCAACSQELAAKQMRESRIPEMTPTIGRTVLYKLSEHDAKLINQHRQKVEDSARNIAKFAGTDDVVHLVSGNLADGGQIFPAVVVRTFLGTTVNLKVQLDGSDDYWATSRSEGDGPGFWSWPPRA